ncbi:hypothetical protein CISG_05352 [Coccidioides immitis RMSCC 3703]|uniref:Uncharacterized protein n=1 Tax=Coccidioides immitis RMSCC 3703 TaxID=454286 RepID=A0A0J8QTB3_COCIT|nr:hypothetical protein CISG_05352 [Coccidioides immitis RMSCC 3703]
MSALLITLPYRYLKYTFRLMREWGLLSAKLARGSGGRTRTAVRDEKGLSRRSRGPLGWEEFVVEENENITVSRIWKGIGTAASAGKGPRSAEPGRPNGKIGHDQSAAGKIQGFSGPRLPHLVSAEPAGEREEERAG